MIMNNPLNKNGKFIKEKRNTSDPKYFDISTIGICDAIIAPLNVIVIIIT